MAVIPPTPTPRAPGLVVLDGLRGGAALYVMIGHALWLLDPEAGPRAGRPWWEWIEVAVRFVFRNGHAYVMLFFVLSGLVIHLGLARRRRTGDVTFDLRRYASSRIRRIYPPLVGALAWTAAVDTLRHAIAPGFYAAVPQVGVADVASDLSWMAFWGNLLFLQGFAVPNFGSNGALWSLAYEGFFYVLYPLFVVTLYRRRGPRWAFGLCWALAAACAVAWQIQGTKIASIGFYFGIWLGGAALAEVIASGTREWMGWLFPAGAGGIAALTLFGYGALPAALEDFLWSLAWALVMLGLASESRSRLTRWIRGRVESLRHVAPYSYSLYLIHLPLLMCLSAIYLTFRPTLPRHFVLAAAGIALSILLASLMARLERIGR